MNRSCAAIHDLSGLGKCSLTVILPVLSVCGVETSVLPTAVLSTHTGGFSHVVFRDLTQDLLPMARHWKSEGSAFSSLYSGFLGSVEQIGIVEEIFRMFRGPDTLVLVDPVMGDGGKLYRTYSEEMALGMERLCARADVIVPNTTEACRLLHMPYHPGPYTRDWVEEVLEKLCKLGPRIAVLTGVWEKENALGAACLDASRGKVEFAYAKRVEGSYHGTGDLFSSCLLGGLLNGMEIGEACGLSVEFTRRCAETTREMGGDLRFGAKFEEHLPWLGEEMARFRQSALSTGFQRPLT